MSHSEASAAIRRSDYRPPSHRFEQVELDFELYEDGALVSARIEVRANAGARELELHGEELETLEVSIDGRPAGARAEIRADRLVLRDLPEAFRLETRVRIHPERNTQLSGLYRSGGIFCTQCEAEGFRRITWFLDRPDVMTRYRVRLAAERARYPVLLSNGNCIERGELPGGRHFVRFEDPFKKPSYLFALVAGDLHVHSDRFVTRSGRQVALEIYVAHQDAGKTEHAMRSLQQAMAWDEREFGLEYDLDLYMIVAVADFNMGAMENKGLNIFNTSAVLARPDTATDDEYERIQGVIAHEYFHNWTGNRVTCRDWFQLTLKEGLTVYRDQRFSADHGSALVKRIDDVRTLRTRQFPEDSGPMSHPIRPESYIAIDNFYTPTVYEKGAEVVRLYETLLGRDGFRRGMDLYFGRHDGQAVTCDDFRAAMADANGRNLDQFERWYSTRGTPRLVARLEHDAARRTATLVLRQEAPRNLPTEQFEPLHMPVRMALFERSGRQLPLRLAGASDAPLERVLELTEREQRFEFQGLAERPIASLLRGYSAPVALEFERGSDELAFLFAHDTDPFNRWEAGQVWTGQELLRLAAEHRAGRPLEIPGQLAAAFERVLDDPGLDGSARAQALTLPANLFLAQQMPVIDPDALHAAREALRRFLARSLRERWLALYEANRPRGPYAADQTAIGARRSKHVALAYLCALEDRTGAELAWRQYQSADNMSDVQAALVCLCSTAAPEREQALEHFYVRWKAEALVLDKWFAVQASVQRADVVEKVAELTRHPDFNLSNPNRARALIGAFAQQNLYGFHRRDGAGYRILADSVAKVQAKNPQLAARLVSAFNAWKRYDPARQAAMRAELERLRALPDLSRDVYEIVSRALTG
jgi:aminopeptidase N